MGARADLGAEELRKVCDGSRPVPQHPNDTQRGRMWSAHVRDVLEEMRDAAAQHAAGNMDNWSLLANLRVGNTFLQRLLQGVKDS
jgi:hypothetical protein